MEAIVSACDTDREEGPKASEEADEFGAARKRVQAKRDFTSHVVAYVVINAFLIGVWALTGGYFWPAWVLCGWGAGLVLHGWETYFRRPVTDEDVWAELDRSHR